MAKNKQYLPHLEVFDLTDEQSNILKKHIGTGGFLLTVEDYRKIYLHHISEELRQEIVSTIEIYYLDHPEEKEKLENA